MGSTRSEQLKKFTHSQGTRYRSTSQGIKITVLHEEYDKYLLKTEPRGLITTERENHYEG